MSLASAQTPETIYEKQWAITLLEHTLARLEREMSRSKHAEHLQHFTPFLTLEGGGVSYRGLAQELGMSETSIKVAIHRMDRGRHLAIRAGMDLDHVGPGPSGVGV